MHFGRPFVNLRNNLSFINMLILLPAKHCFTLETPYISPIIHSKPTLHDYDEAAFVALNFLTSYGCSGAVNGLELPGIVIPTYGDSMLETTLIRAWKTEI